MKNKCKHCGHEWIGRIDTPLACPKCKQYEWEVKDESAKKREA